MNHFLDYVGNEERWSKYIVLECFMYVANSFIVKPRRSKCLVFSNLVIFLTWIASPETTHCLFGQRMFPSSKEEFKNYWKSWAKIVQGAWCLFPVLIREFYTKLISYGPISLPTTVAKMETLSVIQNDWVKMPNYWQWLVMAINVPQIIIIVWFLLTWVSIHFRWIII